ncbi:unnamed protein product [Mycena citricolor]|uniref:Uncharacterized protein n=1 Tax=Mycena citricolor TaxID=2018698 RepID=A0AAD2K7S1_9AGAR|nr:unnamed protein product [Mycena citricolor]
MHVLKEGTRCSWSGILIVVLQRHRQELIFDFWDTRCISRILSNNMSLSRTFSGVGLGLRGLGFGGLGSFQTNACLPSMLDGRSVTAAPASLNDCMHVRNGSSDASCGTGDVFGRLGVGDASHGGDDASVLFGRLGVGDASRGGDDASVSDGPECTSVVSDMEKGSLDASLISGSSISDSLYS